VPVKVLDKRGSGAYSVIIAEWILLLQTVL
jgi:hypothetical protein